MDALRHDLRYALRSFVRSPDFSALTVSTLALGIGAATAIFSVIYGVLLRPLPYPDSDRIVRVYEVENQGGRINLSDPDFADFQARSTRFSMLAQLQGAGPTSVSGDVEPVRAPQAVVSRDFFRVLGVQPLAGRGFVPEEQREGGPPAVMVSHRFWQQHLGATPAFGGRTLVFNGRVHRVVGVLPPHLDYPVGADLFTPRELEKRLPSRTAHNWTVIGRLRPGVPLANAQAEMSAIARRLKADMGAETDMADAALVPLHEQLVGHVRPALLVLLGASGVLLLIACANVSNLLLARSATRQRELAVRVAIGAGRARIVRQLVAESLVLSLAGGAVGVIVAVVGVQALLALEPGTLPRLGEVGVSWTALVFAFGVALATALLLGLVTALRGAGEGALRQALAQSQRGLAAGGSYVRSGLVVAQVALTLVLLVGAGLLGRSFAQLLSVNPGYRTAGAVVVDLSTPWPETDAEAARQRRFYDDLMARLGAVPGVANVGGINAFPLRGAGYSHGTFLELTRPDEKIDMATLGTLFRDPARTGRADFRVATDGYFRAMGIPLVRGRLFDDRDAPQAPLHAAVISAALAKAEWPDSDPIGKIIQFGNMDGDLTPFTVVGVVGDIREARLDATPQPVFYANARQRRVSSFSVVVQGSADPGSVTTAARRIVRELAPSVPPRFRMLEDVVSTSVVQRRFSLVLLGVFGGAALLLAMMGVYSVVSYLVAQRQHEIGIRVALGAQRGDVLGLVLRHGAVLTVVGIAVGLAAALWLTRLLAGLLYGVTPTDPVSFASVVALLLSVALVASYIPARRALRVDPMNVLRNG
ncbi:MAG: ABC transporter permease [Gemmatimonadota bacterium]|nr:ABC transporter permease [Gemmatimonadota bacterium]